MIDELIFITTVEKTFKVCYLKFLTSDLLSTSYWVTSMRCRTTHYDVYIDVGLHTKHTSI